ncbi:Negative regulator of mitotic exit [Borealophlyctis nickersoniae]|nr:Negative regulator of mitotic exit [Borealophlyctis nickersoniae]
MQATANRIIVLGGQVVGSDSDPPPGPDVVHNRISSPPMSRQWIMGQDKLPISRTKYIQCFGGWLTGSRFGQYFNILSIFDTTTLKWIRTVQYPEVSGRADGAGVVLGSSFYLYGGIAPGGQRPADFLRIDLTTYTLTRINASGTSPGARILPFRIPNSSRTAAWTALGTPSTIPPTPSLRYGTGCTVLNGSFYSFGGSDGSLRNDLWVLEPRNQTWRLLSPHSDLGVANVPSPRHYTRLVTLGKYLVTYGGIDVVTPIQLATDKLLYFYNTQTGAWVNSSDVLSDPWFKGLSPSVVGPPPEGQGRDNGANEGGVNIGAVAGGVVAGIVLIVAVVGGIMYGKRNARYLGDGKADVAGGPLPLQSLPVPEVMDVDALHMREVLNVDNGGKLETPEYYGNL